MDLINLVIDSNFQALNKQSWIMDDCLFKTDNNKVILSSTSKVFGMHQNLKVVKNSRLYFRFNFKSETFLSKVTIGVKIGNTLQASSTSTILNINQMISIIVDNKEENITLFIICESNSSINRVQIDKPMLLNLTTLNKGYELKSILDKLKYVKSLKYINILQSNVLSDIYLNTYIWELNKTDENDLIFNINNKLLLECHNQIKLKLKKELIIDHCYLFKINLKHLNHNGFISITYGDQVSKEINNELYIIFKAKKNTFLNLKISQNIFYNLAYLVILEKVMLIDLTADKLQRINEADILNLNYIK